MYRRISQTDDEFDKVDNQDRNLRDFAASQGYEIVADYCDDGISAYKDDVFRPAWNSLLDAIPTDKFDVIIATFENRLSRQMTEKFELLTKCKAAGVSWHTIHNGKVDPTDSNQRLITIINGWQAETEVSTRVLALKDRFARERADGKPLWGIRPFGFEKNRMDHFHGDEERRYDEAAEIRWAYDQVLEGKTLYSIMKSWRDRGIKTTNDKEWSYATIQQLLRRESNAGLWNSKRMAWDPIVPQATFDAVQALLKRPERRTTYVREPRWLMAGIVRCGTCGAPMRSAKGADRKTSFPVYRCSATMTTGKSTPVFGADGSTKRHASVKCDDLDREVRAAVAAAFMFAPVTELPGDATELSDIKKARTELESVRASLKRATTMALNPDFDLSALAADAAALRDQEAKLVEEIDGIVNRSAQSAMFTESGRDLLKGTRVDLDEAAEFKAQLERRFDSLTLHQRRTLVRGLLDVMVFTGRKPERMQIWHTKAVNLNPEHPPREIECPKPAGEGDSG